MVRKVIYECILCFFFFKQKTAYEMRISDWSSDVCSSDLDAGRLRQFVAVVIAFPAFGAGIAAGDAIDERILVDGKLDHMVKLHALGRQQRIERLGLGHGARKTVENETARQVGLVEQFGQSADDDLVRARKTAG